MIRKLTATIAASAIVLIATGQVAQAAKVTVYCSSGEVLCCKIGTDENGDKYEYDCDDGACASIANPGGDLYAMGGEFDADGVCVPFRSPSSFEELLARGAECPHCHPFEPSCYYPVDPDGESQDPDAPGAPAALHISAIAESSTADDSSVGLMWHDPVRWATITLARALH